MDVARSWDGFWRSGWKLTLRSKIAIKIIFFQIPKSRHANFWEIRNIVNRVFIFGKICLEDNIGRSVGEFAELGLLIEIWDLASGRFHRIGDPVSWPRARSALIATDGIVTSIDESELLSMSALADRAGSSARRRTRQGRSPPGWLAPTAAAGASRATTS